MLSIKAGRRRRRALLATGILAASVMGVAMRPVGAAPPTLDRTLADYTLFAQRSLTFKGTGARNNSKITHGNIGVNQPFGTLKICGGGSGHDITMDTGSQIVAWSATIGDNCDLSGTDVFTSDLGQATIQSPVGSRTVLPASTWLLDGFIDPTSPADPNYQWFHPAWPQNGQCLTPTIGNGAKFTIGTDNAVYCNFSTGKNAVVTIDPSVHTIWVLGLLNIGNGTKVNDGNDSHPVRFFVRGDKVKTTSYPVNFGVGVSFVGDVDALAAQYTLGISLGRGANLVGRFWGQQISSDFGTVVNPPPTTTTSTTDTTFNF